MDCAGANDAVSFDISPASGAAPQPVFELRFYAEVPCQFEEPQTSLKPCARSHQVYPVTDASGFTPPNDKPLQQDGFAFPTVTGGAIEPGGSGTTYKRLFVGVRLKQGSCNSGYSLHVGIQRQGKGIHP